MLRHVRIVGIERIGFPAQCQVPGGVRTGPSGDRFHVARKIGGVLGQFRNAAPAQTGDQHPQVFILGFQDLLDHHNGTHGIHILEARVIYLDILLRHQQKGLIVLHSCIQGHNGFQPTHIKMNRLFRKHRQPPQGQNWHSPGINGFAHR